MALSKVNSATGFDSDQLVRLIQHITDSRPLWVAYSGGIDSHVLAHFMAKHADQFTQSIQLIHVNHGLQSQSEQWAQHCVQVAKQLALPLTVCNVTVLATDELGMEAAARQARYQAIAETIGDGVLLTAQHQQDQAETLMLQLLRGSGVLGLSAMQLVSQWQSMTIVRPMLSIAPELIFQYAQKYQLNWIDDPSNHNTQIRRNFLRHDIWPALQTYWPELNQTLARSAEHLSEAQNLLDALAAEDLAHLAVDWDQRSMDVSKLLALPNNRQKNTLRYFLRQLKIALPTTAILDNIFTSVCQSAEDSIAVVQWQNYAARRYRGRLYFLVQEDSGALLACFTQSPSPVQLSETLQLSWRRDDQHGLREMLLIQGVMIQYRRGGEKIRLYCDGPNYTLKNLLQSWAILPWKRDFLPLIFIADQLVAVADHAVIESVRPKSGEQGWFPVLQGY